jgi:hypothetical protein
MNIRVKKNTRLLYGKIVLYSTWVVLPQLVSPKIRTNLIGKTEGSNYHQPPGGSERNQHVSWLAHTTCRKTNERSRKCGTLIDCPILVGWYNCHGSCPTRPPRPLQASVLAFRWHAIGGPRACSLFEMGCLSFF